jgi:hypothetical protein
MDYLPLTVSELRISYVPAEITLGLRDDFDQGSAPTVEVRFVPGGYLVQFGDDNRRVQQICLLAGSTDTARGQFIGKETC